MQSVVNRISQRQQACWRLCRCTALITGLHEVQVRCVAELVVSRRWDANCRHHVTTERSVMCRPCRTDVEIYTRSCFACSQSAESTRAPVSMKVRLHTRCHKKTKVTKRRTEHQQALQLQKERDRPTTNQERSTVVVWPSSWLRSHKLINVGPG